MATINNVSVRFLLDAGLLVRLAAAGCGLGVLCRGAEGSFETCMRGETLGRDGICFSGAGVSDFTASDSEEKDIFPPAAALIVPRPFILMLPLVCRACFISKMKRSITAAASTSV